LEERRCTVCAMAKEESKGQESARALHRKQTMENNSFRLKIERKHKEMGKKAKVCSAWLNWKGFIQTTLEAHGNLHRKYSGKHKTVYRAPLL
ncbi:Hypothetical predicted protein, partial [Podarcis lilfordi]